MEEKRNIKGTEKATGWLIAIFIFAVLGGLLGLIFGIQVYRDKKYIKTHRNLALLGAILSIVSIFIWKFSMM